jgi:FtsZ-interacting cell division protein ZipA
MRARDLIRRDLHGDDNDDGGIMKIIDSDSSMDNNMLKLEHDVNDISALVYGRKLMDTLDGTANTPEQKEDNILKPVEDIKPLVQQPIQPVQPTQHVSPVQTAPLVPQDDHVKSDKAKPEQIENFLKGGNKRASKTNVLLDALAVAKAASKKDEAKNEINIVKKKANINDADNYFDEMLNN